MSIRYPDQPHVPERYRLTISRSLESLNKDHAVFAGTILPATRIFRITTAGAELTERQRFPEAGLSCTLPRLVGHEKALLSLVGDFAGIVRGRKHRNALETMCYL
jgi:hypothetical protein